MLGLLGDKKKIVQLILAESPKKLDKEVPQGMEGDFSPALEAYANDLIAAVKNEDPKMLVNALKELIVACEKEEEYVPSVEQVEA
jgi:hypothetical protein